MRAIRVHELGPAEVLRLEQLPDPVPADGQLLVSWSGDNGFGHSVQVALKLA